MHDAQAEIEGLQRQLDAEIAAERGDGAYAVKLRSRIAGRERLALRRSTPGALVDLSDLMGLPAFFVDPANVSRITTPPADKSEDHPQFYFVALVDSGETHWVLLRDLDGAIVQGRHTEAQARKAAEVLIERLWG